MEYPIIDLSPPTTEGNSAKIAELQEQLGAEIARGNDMLSILVGHQRALEQTNVVFAEANANVIAIEDRLHSLETLVTEHTQVLARFLTSPGTDTRVVNDTMGFSGS